METVAREGKLALDVRLAELSLRVSPVWAVVGTAGTRGYGGGERRCLVREAVDHRSWIVRGGVAFWNRRGRGVGRGDWVGRGG